MVGPTLICFGRQDKLSHERFHISDKRQEDLSGTKQQVAPCPSQRSEGLKVERRTQRVPCWTNLALTPDTLPELTPVSVPCFAATLG